MKNKIYLLLLAVFILASCSSENITENTGPATNLLTLKKVETYYPSKAAYDSIREITWASKRVQYFQDGLIVADSSYNYTHELDYVTAHTYSANHASIITYNRDNIATNTYLFTYDTRGRITEFEVNYSQAHSKRIMSYNNDGTTTYTDHNLTTGEIYEPVGAYTANADGILSYFTSPNENESLIYEGGKPVTYTQATMGSSGIINIEYYNIPIPANRIKTATQINNSTLTYGYLYQSVPEGCGYLKSIENAYEYDSTFNDLNYITHTFRLVYPNNNTDETFYYYNE